MSRGAWVLIVGAVAAALLWGGVSVFKSEPKSAPVATDVATVSDPQSQESVPQSSAANSAAETVPAQAGAPVQAEAPTQPEPPTSAINEVLPTVPQSALDTIRGTVRVNIRVTIDKAGAVLAATPDDPGPSRYFARLSLDAAKQWTFTPAASEQQRTMLVKFNYTRSGATAGAESAE